MERDEKRPDADSEEERGAEEERGSKEEQGPKQERGPEEEPAAAEAKAEAEPAEAGAVVEEEPAEAQAPAAPEEAGPAVPEVSGAEGKTCATCGAPLLPGAGFCGECGTAAGQAEPPPREPRRYVLTAGISAAIAVFGAVLFVAGFWTHSLLDDDVDLDPIEDRLVALDQRTGQIQDVLSGAGGDGTSPTPAPTVPATADDDPFIGPEDASVTIIEFTDYQ